MVYKGPEYPPELTRLLRKGKATYAIGTGPLPDDTDWSKIKYAVLKEECGYRDISASGTVETLRQVLTNYKEPEKLPPAEDISNVVGKGKSTSGEKRKKKWLEGPDHAYHKKMEVIKQEAICLISLRDSSGEQKFGGQSIEFLVVNNRNDGSEYHVSISKMPNCDCPAKNYHAQEHSVLVNVLKVQEPLAWQNAFLSEELEQFFESIVAASPAGTISECNAGVLANGNCPVCFQSMEETTKATVECSDCNVKAHQRCFNILTAYCQGYGRKAQCIACSSDWTQAGTWGTAGIVAEDRAIAEAKTQAKAQKAAQKAAEKAAKEEEKENKRAAREEARAAKEEAKQNKKRKLSDS
ncbi:hypothetical protein LQW54_004390 [Pestalotiopsis sp. IQ-011]